MYPRTTTEITYVPTLHNMQGTQNAPAEHIVYAGYTICYSEEHIVQGSILWLYTANVLLAVGNLCVPNEYMYAM